MRRLRASEVYFGTQVQGIIYLRAPVIRATCTLTRRTPQMVLEVEPICIWIEGGGAIAATLLWPLPNHAGLIKIVGMVLILGLCQRRLSVGITLWFEVTGRRTVIRL